MSLHRTKATIIGILEFSRVNEWIVTEKLGDFLKNKVGAKAPKKFRLNIGDRYASSHRVLLMILIQEFYVR